MSTSAGIDIGSDAIKGVVLKAGKKGPIEVIGAGSIPIADLSRMADSPDKQLAIGEKLKELIKSARLKAETRRVGASGASTSIRYLQIPPVPPWRLDMLVKYEVEERAEEKEANAFDYHIMDVPETNGQYTVMIGMSREGYTSELLELSKSSGLGEVEIDLEALALYAAYYHGHGYDADKTVAIADIGADDVTVLICKNGALYYARTMLGGGKRFTQNLADDLKLEFAEAEELKKSMAEISFDLNPGASSIGRAAKIQRSAQGTTILPRSGATLLAKTGEPGASQPGLPARSAVSAAPNGVGGVGGVGGGGGAGADENRRSRVPEGAKFVAKPAGASNIQLKPPGGAPAIAPASSAPAPARSAVAQAGASAGMKGMGELDFAIPSLEELELEIPAAPKGAGPIVSPLPVQAPSATPVVEGMSGVAVVVDDYDLQPAESAAPKTSAKPARSAGPAATQTGPAPDLLAATQKMPAPTVSNFGGEIVDLVPVGETAKTFSPGANASAIAPPSLEALDASLAGASGIQAAGVEDPAKRKRQVSAALVREAAGLCAAIENVTMTCKQQSKLPLLKLDRIYITGGASKLKGLAEFMGRRLRVEVVPLEPLKNLSVDRLSPSAYEALKAEQHTLSVALGLALSDLRPGAFNFLLWPAAVKKRKDFWARGAYMYYAAGAAMLAMGVMLYTPSRNSDKLSQNYVIADEAAKKAERENNEIRDQDKLNGELRHRLTTITDNVQSGDYFLNVLAELKSRQRIRDDMYLTAISTSMPNVVIVEAGAEGDTGILEGAKKGPLDPRESRRQMGEGNGGRESSREQSREPNTFQAQRRVYIRGFVRGPQKEGLVELVLNFRDRLVPHPEDPDNPQNLFKDIRPLWYSKEDNKQGAYYLKEFILEAYTETPKVADKKAEEKGKSNSKKGGAKGAPTVPASTALKGAPAAVSANPQAGIGPAEIRQNPVKVETPAPLQQQAPVERLDPIQQINPVVPPVPSVPPVSSTPTQPNNQAGLLPYLKEVLKNNPAENPQPAQPVQVQPLRGQPVQPAAPTEQSVPRIPDAVPSPAPVRGIKTPPVTPVEAPATPDLPPAAPVAPVAPARVMPADPNAAQAPKPAKKRLFVTPGDAPPATPGQ